MQNKLIRQVAKLEQPKLESVMSQVQRWKVTEVKRKQFRLQADQHTNERSGEGNNNHWGIRVGDYWTGAWMQILKWRNVWAANNNTGV